MGWRVGIDVGGTFTDVCLLDDDTGAMWLHKLLSTPATPEDAPIQGMRRILAQAGLAPHRLDFVGVGTTVATNAILERKGARTGLITTRGFRDLLEIGRQKRPDVYNVYLQKPAPLVSRDLRLDVAERVAPDGTVITAIDPDEVGAVIRQLLLADVQSVAVCFLHSYVNPSHERQVTAAIRAAWPEGCVSASHEVLPEFREYERFSSTVVNAYLMPATKRYFAKFTECAKALGVRSEPLVVTSAGGVVSAAVAKDRPVDLLLSGPSAGVTGATYVAELCGERDVITFDMGGTSTDVSLIWHGRPEVAMARIVNDIPVKTTAVDVHTVGAGGGSLAWVDRGGLLRVGPSSAGAHPGPACYGRGGDVATVTDANLLLGRLNPGHLLGGALKLHPELAARAISATVATKKGVTPVEAAAAILAVCTANAAQAVRVVSVERGYDPRDLTLVAFGGAGPLHAAAVARELGVRHILIPRFPGVLSAFGVLAGDLGMSFSQTKLINQEAPSAAQEIHNIFSVLEMRARKVFSEMRSGAVKLQWRRIVDMRYLGQNHELPVEIVNTAFDERMVRAARETYHTAHERLYGFQMPDQPVEFVTYRLHARVPGRRPVLASQPEAHVQPPEPAAHRKVFFDESQEFIDSPIYSHDALTPGVRLCGPAIVEQPDATTVIPPGFTCRIDRFQNLHLMPV